MGYINSIIVFCDKCYHEEVFKYAKTSYYIKEDAKRNGWTFKGRKCYCKECSKEIDN